MKCPNCGVDGTGNFCASCGAPLQPAACAKCGAALLPGARFCTQCGTGVGAGGGRQLTAASGGGNKLPWYLAGGVFLALIVVLFLPTLLDDPPDPTPAAQQGGTGAPGPLTGTPREQADRLYDRIMREREAGDTVRAKFFTPMAMQAYQNAEPLDDDGLYHLAAIQIVAEHYPGALSTANRILAGNPNHLLALAIAGEAATKAGDNAAARDFYQRFLRAYDAEMAKGLEEYQGHARVLEEYQRTARAAVGQ